MLPVRERNRLTRYMIGFKRYIRSGLIVSVIGHLGGVIVALLSVSPNAFHAPPPDAMVVEVVTTDELPRFEGTLSKLYSSGSETPSPADGKGPVTEAPPPKPRAQTEQETQQRPIPRPQLAPRAVEQHHASAAGGGRDLVRGECARCVASRDSCRPVPSTCAWTVQTSLAFMPGRTRHVL